METAIAAIEKQQREATESSAAWCVGEQLKDILRSMPEAAEIVEQDIAQKGMGIADCEHKIKGYADQHRHGGCGFCPPHEADRIIREFYGIAALGTEKAGSAAAGGKIVNLLDLM